MKKIWIKGTAVGLALLLTGCSLPWEKQKEQTSVTEQTTTTEDAPTVEEVTIEPLKYQVEDGQIRWGDYVGAAFQEDTSHEALKAAVDAMTATLAGGEIWVTRGDTLVCSVIAKVDNRYTGGTWNTETGQEVKLADIAGESMVTALVQAWEERNPEAEVDAQTYFQNGLEEDTLVWGFSGDGLDVYVNPGDLLTDETTYLHLSFAEEADVVTSEYQAFPESFVTPVFTDRAYALDGSALYIQEVIGENGDLEKVDLYYNSTISVYEIEAYAYDVDYRLITKGESRYLYVDCTIENGAHQLYAWDLSTEEVKEITFGDGEVALYGYDISDVQQFEVGKQFALLSTYELRRHASISEQGAIDYNGDYWMVADMEDVTLTTLQDMLTIQLNSDTGEDYIDSEDCTKVSLPAGTALTLYRTDGDRIVDLKDRDGNIYRFTVDQSYGGSGVYDQYINGTPVEYLFDGMVFAG